MFEVTSGQDSETIRELLFLEERAILLNVRKSIVHLKGSSEDRSDAREYHYERARDLGVPFRCYGKCVIEIGGSMPRTQRGMRYFRFDLNHADWINWRKEKRITRGIGRNG